MEGRDRKLFLCLRQELRWVKLFENLLLNLQEKKLDFLAARSCCIFSLRIVPFVELVAAPPETPAKSRPVS